MKLKFVLTSLLALSIALATHAMAKENSESDLAKKAKVTKEEAQKTALSQVKNGTVKEAELEEENGKLVWSFDITTPDSKDITEVQIDAITGKVVSIEKETEKDHEKEEDEDHDKE
jgi:uncharacterized membrane protein YkoI